MKHIFIINPNAGKGSAATELENKLKDSGFDWQVYRTTAPNDSFRFAKEYCEINSHPVRFYACGGDGTIHEIANAIYGFPHASMQDMIIYCRAKNMEVKAEKEFTVSLDGELRKMKEATVEIVPSALRFGVPEVAENATNT